MLEKEKEDATAAEIENGSVTPTPPGQLRNGVPALDISRVSKAKVLRKQDLRLIPCVTVLYLLSFLDRGYV